MGHEGVHARAEVFRIVLKSFIRAQGSQEVSFWEDYFSSQSFDYLVASFNTDPLRPLFERYCSNGALVLEGGCGLGNYLPSLRALGAKPLGLDFGVDLLREVRRREQATPLTAGDICALPFGDKTFDVYYSGGVMEHFEGGPARGLAEAYRVLKPGGILLASVPYENPVRRFLARVQPLRSGLLTTTVQRETTDRAPEGQSFFQYFYRAHEFREHVQAAGFEVVAEQPYSMWRGLTDLPPFRWIDNLYAGRSSDNQTPGFLPAPGQEKAPSQRRSWLKARLKHAVFAEDRSVPGVGLLISAGCELAANMRMYVCRRAD
jgi:SAM-dependent methyltransferase